MGLALQGPCPASPGLLSHHKGWEGSAGPDSGLALETTLLGVGLKEVLKSSFNLQSRRRSTELFLPETEPAAPRVPQCPRQDHGGTLAGASQGLSRTQFPWELGNRLPGDSVRPPP